VLEIEDRDPEASQVVPLLDDRRHVVTGDDEPDQSRTLRSRLPPVPVALKLLEALGASDRVVAGACATLAAVGAATGADPPGVESVVNSPMSAPPDRLPFSRVERRRAAINRIAASSSRGRRPRRGLRRVNVPMEGWRDLVLIALDEVTTRLCVSEVAAVVNYGGAASTRCSSTAW
jgi:hypothetical protein